MTFKSPHWLWALLALPLIVAVLVAWARERRRAAGSYADPQLLDVSPRRRTRAFRAAAAIVAVLACASGVVALARPAIDRTGEKDRSTIIIALDTSESMTKTDISPSRLAAAVDASRRFLQVAPKDGAIGLVTFDNGARVRVSPVDDRSEVGDALGSLPIGVGTAIGDAVVASISAIEASGALAPPPESAETSPARILLLTDGANSVGSSPLSAAERAKAERVPVYTVLLGNDPGRPDQLTPAETLTAIANQTGGVFTQSTSTEDLRRVFEDIGSSITTERRLEELTVWVVLGAIGLLLVAAGLLALAEVRPARAAPRTA